MKKLLIIFVALILSASFCLEVKAGYGEDLGKIVVTATRIAQSDYKISSDVTVITREQIEASNAQSVPEVLEGAVGLFVYDKSTTKSSVLDIRGFGDTAKMNTLVLVNDRRVNSIDLSGPDLMQIPLEEVERIEIIRGAGSVLYGDNAVGGVVNIITKKGEGELSGKIGSTFGSYDTQGSDIELSGEYNDVSYFLYSKYLDERGYRQNSDVLSKDFNARLGYEVSDKVSVDFNFGAHRDNADLPGGLDESELASLGRRGAADTSNITTTDDKFYQLGLDINPWPEDLYFGDFVIDLHYRDKEVFESFGGYDADRNIITKGITAKYIFDKTLFDREVNFVTGIDYYETQNDIVGSGTNTDDLTISKDELGIYGFLQYELFENMFVNGGTRYHRAGYAFSKHDTFSDEEKDPDEWVSMGGLKYEYGKGSNVYASVQQTFRFLATDEWYSTWSGLNTDLKQQTGIQYEVGVKHNVDDIVLLSVTPYWIENKDEIYYNSSTWTNTNYDKTRRTGVEAGANLDVLEVVDVDFLDKLNLYTNYTFQRPIFKDGTNDGNHIPMVPRHQITAGLTTEFLDNYGLSLIGKYVGSRYIINDIANEMPRAKPYCVLDAKLAYKKKNMEVYVGVNNIFDKLYSPYQIKKTATTRDYYPAQTRNYNFGVDIKF
ncbi:MAG: TonB-dependent receptor [Candidatus Zapsychrus exili]|nr:TonB-dependent receptor [Candidatus Zapsychrus exili]